MIGILSKFLMKVRRNQLYPITNIAENAIHSLYFLQCKGIIRAEGVIMNLGGKLLEVREAAKLSRAQLVELLKKRGFDLLLLTISCPFFLFIILTILLLIELNQKVHSVWMCVCFSFKTFTVGKCEMTKMKRTVLTFSRVY